MAGPWDKYAAAPAEQAGPWTKYGTEQALSFSKMPKPPSTYERLTAPYDVGAENFAQQHPVLGVPVRALSAAGGAVLGAPGSIYHAFADEPTPEEVKMYGGPEEVKGAKRIGLGIGRLTAQPVAEAVKSYADPATRPTLRQAASVLPEALGTGVGTVAIPEMVRVAGVGLNRAVPSTTRSGAGIGILKERFAEVPADVKAPHQTLTKFVERAERTREPIPAQVKAVMDRVAAGDIEGKPMTFAELADHRTAINDILWDREASLPAWAKGQLKYAAQQMGDVLNRTAQENGFGKQWRQMDKEYARGSSIIRAGEKAGPYMGAAAGWEAGRLAGVPLGMEFIMGAGGRYLGKPIVGSLVRSVIEREGGPPRLGNLPEPPATAPSPPPPPALPDRRIISERVPPEMEKRSGFERRSDVAERERISKMTPEEIHRELYTDQLTGAGSRRAFQEAPQAPAYGFSDVAGLKWLNDDYGQATGNQLLKAKVKALREAGLDVYRLGGDEFGARAASPAELVAGYQRAQEILRETPLEVTDPKTGKVELYKGAEMRFGTGPDIGTAEQVMNQAKKKSPSTRGKQGTLVKIPEPPE